MRLETDCRSCLHFPHSIFSGVDDRMMDLLNEQKTTHFYKKAQVVFFEDRLPVGIYCLLKGKVKISKATEDGKDQIVRIVNTGGMLGVKSMLAGTKHTTTAVTLEDSEICYIPKIIFSQILTTCDSITGKLMLHLIKMLEEGENKIASLAQKPVRQRMADMMLMLDQMFSTDAEERAWICMSREDLGSIIGTATASVIRLLAEFKELGYIETQGRKIRIINHEAMKAESLGRA